MTTLARSLAAVLAMAAAACGPRPPQPVEPYSPADDPPPAAASTSAAASVAAPPAVAPPEQDARSQDCQRLSSAITANSEAIKTALDSALEGKDVKGLAELATSVEDAGAKVMGLELSAPRLKGWANEYQALVSELADAIRRTASDRAAKNKPAIRMDLGDLRKLDEKQGDLIRRINALCSA